MQTLAWYLNRLRGMSPAEVAWRGQALWRGAVERGLLAAGWRPRLATLATGHRWAPRFQLSDVAVGEWAQPAALPEEAAWLARLRPRAERAAAHRLSYFELEDRQLGDPIDWNRDHAHDVAAPRGVAAGIDYRDFSVTGDAKHVWEPNRHQHLVVLGRAYRASGELRYASAVVEQLESWFEQCPYPRGMNWRSPLELAIRLINWTWTIDLILESGLVSGAFLERLLDSVFLHVRDIARKYSRGSSANNHRIGEAAGVFVASSYFGEAVAGPQRAEAARAILEQEIRAQTHDDGGNREQALGYHRFVLEFLLVAGLAARRAGADMSAGYWSLVERMLDFLEAVSAGGDRLPLFGDCDDGYVLDLGRAPLAADELWSLGALLFRRAELGSAGLSETARWLWGREACTSLAELPPGRADASLASRAFPRSGYYLLQAGQRGAGDGISVLFDCGELGLGAIAAHGHADALSLLLRVGGRDVLVDCGTYDYFSFPEWHTYFRSSFAHNTLVVDGQDQSVMTGPFLWGRKARSRCLAWEVLDHGARAEGEHDGYTRLADPVVHRRSVTLDARRRVLSVEDRIAATGEHEVAILFHFAEDCAVTPLSAGRWRACTGAVAVVLETDPALDATLLRGSLSPRAGWVSRAYHRKSPSATVVARARSRGEARFSCRLLLGEPGAEEAQR